MIENRKPTATFKGDGSTTVFPVSFALSAASDLHVSIYDTAAGTAKELTRDYYVDMTGKAVHYPGYAPGQEPAEHDRPPALPAGKTITLYRRTDIDQRTDLGEKYPLPYIERMSDKATAIMQELEEQIGRSVKVAIGDPKTADERLTELHTYVSDAKTAAQSAGASERSAGDSSRAAADSQRAAEASRRVAEKSAVNAENHERAAKEARNEAVSAMESAGRSASAAATAQSGAVSAHTESEDVLRRVKRSEEYMQSVGAEMDGYVGIAVRTVAERIKGELSKDYVPWSTDAVYGNADWNELTAAPFYEIEATHMTEERHAPVGVYNFGVLLVHRAKAIPLGENRLLQIYYPHNHTEYYMRMRNGNIGEPNNMGWSPWVRGGGDGIIASSLKENGWCKFANGLIVQWGDVSADTGVVKDGYTEVTWTYPIAFRDKAYFCVPTPWMYGRHTPVTIASNIHTDEEKVKIHFHSTGDRGFNIHMFAIGV
jgi:hypothetical protein